MDDGVRKLAVKVVDFALRAELTDEEEAELLELLAAAYLAAVMAAAEVRFALNGKLEN